ncbi:hypothetical protein CLCR_06742 [Cladophialophora carrionii]|uniref:Uncharacterized protein n=1 Tax=Cladophialophora carrionii TaxID=86049 RepID=A0A1C1CN75_9EURO|nr:hypothetical protein CLCR_06742 [Cladophialophora carrionii]
MDPSRAPGSRPRRSALPVNRRAAFQANPRHAPIPVTPEEQRQRLTAMRNQIGYPDILDATLRFHLMHVTVNWDVDRAVMHYWETENAANAPPARPRSGVRTDSTVERERRRTVHRMQRRLRSGQPARLPEEMTLAPEDGGQQGVPQAPAPLSAERATTNAVMMTMFNQHRFNRADAAADIDRRNGYYNGIVDEIARLRSRPDGQMARDERLALFLSITATNSVFAAQEFLSRHRWDIAAAIDEWIRTGRIPLAFPPFKSLRSGRPNTNHGLRGVNANWPRRVMHGTIPESRAELDAFDRYNADPDKPIRTPHQPYDDEDQVDSDIEDAHSNPVKNGARTRGLPLDASTPVPGQEYTDVGRGRKRKRIPAGFVINPDRTPARLHCPDPTKLYIETITKGKYKIRYFEGRCRIKGAAKGQKRDWPFLWDDENADTTKGVEFDWHDKEHLAKLNRWRNNAYTEITGSTVREPVGDKFNKYEQDWLREQEAMALEEKYHQLAQRGAAADFRNGNNFPMGMSDQEVQDLTQRFNATFAGKSKYDKVIYRCNRLPPRPDGSFPAGAFRYTRQTVTKDMRHVGTVPRPARTATVIKQQRHRILNLAKHFMFSYEWKESYGVEDEIDLVDESDSDFVDDDDDDDDDDQGGDDDGDDDDDDDDDGTGAGASGGGSGGGAAGDANNGNEDDDEDDDDDDDAPPADAADGTATGGAGDRNDAVDILQDFLSKKRKR